MPRMKEKHYCEKIILLISGEEVEVPISIIDKKADFDADITVKINYLGIEYVAQGTSLEWTDAFANMQKALPENIKLKCCLTCRHGTLCPYGNIPNYVLCSHSESINDKDDVIVWLDRVDIDGVKRTSFQSCQHFEFANEKHYTYNDFLWYLKK